jgi:hypothetical protein
MLLLWLAMLLHITVIGACESESEHPFVTMKELWELSRLLLGIMMHMSVMGN